MKDAAAYRALVSALLGAEAATFDEKSDATNEVIGALNSPDGYETFRRNFTARLQRLGAVYSPGHPLRQPFLRAVNDVARTKNWEGAYAELSAYDYFHAQNHWMKPTIELDKDIDGSRTFARELSRSGPANLDIFFPRFDVFSDVKCLKDNVADSLAGIYRAAFPNARNRPHIVAQRRMDMSHEHLTANRSHVIRELAEATASGQRPTHIKSTSVPELTFVLKWGTGTLMTESVYSPYRHAEQAHQLVFGYANKLVKDRPSLIVLVNFPWFNQTTSEFRDANRIFYRSFARRVFCQYRHDARRFAEISPKFTGLDSIYDVTRKVSALLFLEDRFITEESNDSANIRGFLYTNPNADHMLLGNSFAADYFSQLKSTELDTFEHDNY